MKIDRVTITLPHDLIEAIDSADSNRSGFLAEAARRELRRRERKAFRVSLDQPYPIELRALASAGLEDWARTLPTESANSDEEDAIPVCWVEGQGWLEGPAAMIARKHGR